MHWNHANSYSVLRTPKHERKSVIWYLNPDYMHVMRRRAKALSSFLIWRFRWEAQRRGIPHLWFTLNDFPSLTYPISAIIHRKSTGEIHFITPALCLPISFFYRNLLSTLQTAIISTFCSTSFNSRGKFSRCPPHNVSLRRKPLIPPNSLHCSKRKSPRCRLNRIFSKASLVLSTIRSQMSCTQTP